MEINKPGRSALKSYFVKNAVPTASNFGDLIDAALNQKDDGIAKPPGEPFSIQADGDDQSQKKAINLYRSFADPKPVWTMSLKGRTNPKDAASGQPGFTISDGDGNTRLYIDEKTGNVGVNTVANAGTARLDVNGPIRANVSNAAKDPDSSMLAGGNLVLKGTTPQIDFIDTDHNDWSIHVNKHKMYFIRQPWEYSDLVLDGAGRVGIGTESPGAKLDVLGTARVVADYNVARDPDSGMTAGGTLVLKGNAPQVDFVDTDHNDWSIHVNSNKMYFIRQPWETTLVLDGAGNVGMGTDAPGMKLDVQGTLRVQTNAGTRDPDSAMTGNGALVLKGTAPQIDFVDTDHNDWSIHVNSNKMYFIRQPWNYTDLVLDGAGNVGIGTDNPVNKLQMGGGNLHMDGNSIFFRQGPSDQYDVIRWEPSVDHIQMGGYAGTTLGDCNTAPGKVRPILVINGAGAALRMGSFQNPSDGRDKTDVEELRYGLEEVLKLRPVSFNWRERPEAGESIGLIAQEVEEVVAEVVHRGGDDPDDRLTLAYSELVPVLINAVKELAARVEELSGRTAPAGQR